MGTFPGPLVYRPCFDLGRTPSEGLGGPLRLRVTRGKSSRPLGGFPWVGLGGTRLWIERPIATSSACAGACCGRAVVAQATTVALAQVTLVRESDTLGQARQ